MVEEQKVLDEIKKLKFEGVDHDTIVRNLSRKFNIRRSDIEYCLWHLRYDKALWLKRRS